MSKISDLAYNSQGGIASPWRHELQPASFRDAYFHTEANAVENGRRIVNHEFPKKNINYAEDMGRRTFEFTVRGYCIQYPRNVEGPGMELYRRDYRIARDLLADALSSGDPGPLRLPTFKGREKVVICPRYRLTEEERSGGYCVFDMTFIELGVAPYEPPPDKRSELIRTFAAMRKRTVDVISAGTGERNV